MYRLVGVTVALPPRQGPLPRPSRLQYQPGQLDHVGPWRAQVVQENLIGLRVLLQVATHPRLSVMFEGQPVAVSPALLRPPAPAMSLVLSRGWGGWGLHGDIVHVGVAIVLAWWGGGGGSVARASISACMAAVGSLSCRSEIHKFKLN